MGYDGEKAKMLGMIKEKEKKSEEDLLFEEIMEGREDAIMRFREMKEARDFCHYFVEYGGDVDAVMRRMHPKLNLRSSEALEAKKIEYMRRTDVRREVVQVMRTFKITASRLIGMAEMIASDEKQKGADRLRAMEMLGKWMKAFPDDEESKKKYKSVKVTNITNNNLSLTDEQKTRLLLRRSNYRLSEDGFEGVRQRADGSDVEYGEGELN